MIERVHVVSPTSRPVGGVVKLADYALHASRAGYATVFHLLTEDTAHPSLLDLDRFHSIGHGGDVALGSPHGLDVGPNDVVVFAWPPDMAWIGAALSGRFPKQRLIHLVQNVRHANPEWLDGAGLRLLKRPMTRICVTEEVAAAIAPWVNPSSATYVIPLGHAWEVFSKTRTGGLPTPLTVGYTTWKSDLGDRVREAMGDDPGIRFEAVRDIVDWHRLVEFYHAIDVFLATPRREEGFYLPGLEAMAAGAIVAIPDVGGNRAYCRFGVNCLQTPFEDTSGSVAALRHLHALDPTTVERMRASGYATLPSHDLASEGRAFADVLRRL